MEPLSFRISLCIRGTATELSFGSCNFECFMFSGSEAVIHIEMCTASEPPPPSLPHPLDQPLGKGTDKQKGIVSSTSLAATATGDNTIGFILARLVISTLPSTIYPWVLVVLFPISSRIPECWCFHSFISFALPLYCLVLLIYRKPQENHLMNECLYVNWLLSR